MAAAVTIAQLSLSAGGLVGGSLRGGDLAIAAGILSSIPALNFCAVLCLKDGKPPAGEPPVASPATQESALAQASGAADAGSADQGAIREAQVLGEVSEQSTRPRLGMAARVFGPGVAMMHNPHLRAVALSTFVQERDRPPIPLPSPDPPPTLPRPSPDPPVTLP